VWGGRQEDRAVNAFAARAAGDALDAAGRTHTGLLRPANEDSLLCEPPVLAVADGLGGHPAGDVASALALEPLADLAEQARAADGPVQADALAAAVRRGNARVHEDAHANPERRGMGTTLTAALVAQEQVHLAHVGDSRAYRWSPNAGLERLTTDHTPAEEAVREGILSPEEAAASPDRHMLLRVVGTEPDVEVDVPDPVTLAPGEALLLCSDGLTEPVPDATIAAVLGAGPSAEQAAEALVAAALDGGGPDNVTVVVAWRR